MIQLEQIWAQGKRSIVIEQDAGINRFIKSVGQWVEVENRKLLK